MEQERLLPHILPIVKDGEKYADKININWDNWSQIDKYLKSIDIIINCTSVGFGDQRMESPLSESQLENLNKSTIVFDIIYQPLKTKLLEMAEKKGLSIFNGLEMNLEQAVLAYEYAIKSDKSLDKIRKIMSQI